MTSKVLITGGNGQLATCIRDIESKFPEHELVYTDYADLDITDFHHLRAYFKENSFEWCINCAAYTAVDRAETEEKKAQRVNVAGAENLAKICNEFRVKLIHISTDFVFDGMSLTPYNENDSTNPLGVYGRTKLDGEMAVKNNCSRHFIIRTSWLYSEHGHNFMKTMLQLSSTRDELNVVADQIGTPTYAGDLAELILRIIASNSCHFGLYHFSNEGLASWYDFAKTIFDITSVDIKVNPIATTDFPTAAKRPKYSVLDKAKIKDRLSIDIPHWQESLNKALKRQE